MENDIIILTQPDNREPGKLLNMLLEKGMAARFLVWSEPQLSIETLKTMTQAAVCVIFVDSGEVLNHLWDKKEWIFRSKIILIVSEPNSEALSAAHKLRPRLVREAGCDYGDIVEILKKMTQEKASEEPSSLRHSDAVHN